MSLKLRTWTRFVLLIIKSFKPFSCKLNKTILLLIFKMLGATGLCDSLRKGQCHFFQGTNTDFELTICTYLLHTTRRHYS